MLSTLPLDNRPPSQKINKTLISSGARLEYTLFGEALMKIIFKNRGLPWWLSGTESACQCRRQWLGPWSGKIPRALGQLSPCIATLEYVLYSLGVPATEAGVIRSPRTREAATASSLSTAAKKGSSLATTRESPCSSKYPAQPKINKIIYLKKLKKKNQKASLGVETISWWKEGCLWKERPILTHLWDSEETTTTRAGAERHRMSCRSWTR